MSSRGDTPRAGVWVVYVARGDTPIPGVARWYVGCTFAADGDVAGALARRRAQHCSGCRSGGALWLQICEGRIDDPLTEAGRAHTCRAALALELKVFLDTFEGHFFAVRGACFSMLTLREPHVAELCRLRAHGDGAAAAALRDSALFLCAWRHLAKRCYGCGERGHFIRACGGAATQEEAEARIWRHSPAEFSHAGGPYWNVSRDRWQLYVPPANPRTKGRQICASVRATEGGRWAVFVAGQYACSEASRPEAARAALAVLLSLEEAGRAIAKRGYNWNPRKRPLTQDGDGS